MAQKRTAGVILPTTAYILKLVPPPVREMIRENVIVALGSGKSSLFSPLKQQLRFQSECSLFFNALGDAFGLHYLQDEYGGSFQRGYHQCCLFSWTNCKKKISLNSILKLFRTLMEALLREKSAAAWFLMLLRGNTSFTN